MSAEQRREVERVLAAGADAARILGCRRTDPAADIRKAFRHAAMLLHPDKNDLPDAPRAFCKLQPALDELLPDGGPPAGASAPPAPAQPSRPPPPPPRPKYTVKVAQPKPAAAAPGKRKPAAALAPT